MLMTDANLLGMAAGTLTTVAFVPQVLKTWRSKIGPRCFLRDVSDFRQWRISLAAVRVGHRRHPDCDHQCGHAGAGAYHAGTQAALSLENLASQLKGIRAFS